MEEIKLISVDAGKGCIKNVFRGNGDLMEKVSYPSKYSKKSIDSLDITGLGINTYDVTFNDESYTIGYEDGEDTRLYGSSKLLDEHRLAMYTSITFILEPNSDVRPLVNVVLSIPALSYVNDKLRTDYYDFFLENKDIDIKVNGDSYSYTINDILLLPEGLGYAINNEDKMKGEHLVLDIGHLNLTFSVFKDGDLASSISSEAGGYELERILQREYHNVFERSIPAGYEYKGLTDGYFGSLEEDGVKKSKEVITKAKNKYLDKIIKEASNLNIPIELFDGIHFIGRHSANFVKEVQEHHFFGSKATISNDPQWETAIGNFLIGTVYFENDLDSNKEEQNNMPNEEEERPEESKE